MKSILSSQRQSNVFCAVFSIRFVENSDSHRTQTREVYLAG